MREKRPPEIGPGGRSWCEFRCEFRCEFLATKQRFQLPRYDSDCPEHRVSTTFCRTPVDLVAASGPGGRWFKSTRPDVSVRPHCHSAVGPFLCRAERSLKRASCECWSPT